jgi:uncharacterized protein (DUF58 family)
MKRGSYVLLTLLVFLYLFTGVLFAQTTPRVALAGLAEAQITTPTPTPNATPPTPTVTQVPAATTEVTAAPTPQTVKPTSAPAQTEQTPDPTATPTPLPPTPTPKPRPIILTASKKPPVQPINNIITAPFDLVMSSLPQSYYGDEGLAPETNKILLSFAFLFLLIGTILLNWPALARTARKISAQRPQARESFPYLTGRALTK